MTIKESVEQLFFSREYRKRVSEYAREKYEEKFPHIVDGKRRQGFHYFDSFEVISEKEVKITYKHGAGEYEYDDYFIVDITEDVRNESINTILK
jgi:hypothetical protein